MRLGHILAHLLRRGVRRREQYLQREVEGVSGVWQCCVAAVLLLLLRTIRSLWCFGSRDERTDHIGPNILGTLMIKIFWTIGGKRPAHASSTGGMYW